MASAPLAGLGRERPLQSDAAGSRIPVTIRWPSLGPFLRVQYIIPHRPCPSVHGPNQSSKVAGQGDFTSGPNHLRMRCRLQVLCSDYAAGPCPTAKTPTVDLMVGLGHGRTGQGGAGKMPWLMGQGN